MSEPALKKKKTEEKPKKVLTINFFENNSSGLQWPGQWRHPRDQSVTYKDIDYWIKLAKIAERGKVNAIFVADSLALFDAYKGPHSKETFRSGIQAPKNEPAASIATMASVTKNLGFAVTFSTISEQPYHLARRLATLDHLTKGRIGWNVVSSFLPSTGRQLLNGEPLPEHDTRYQRTEEYLNAVYELLLSSWRDDAVVLDKETGIFANPERIREINFEGEYYKVAGPSITEPSRQRLPVIVQAGTSQKGREFAAQHAEAVYISGLTPEVLGQKIKSFRDLVESYGRDRYDVKFICSATVITAETDEEAKEKFEEIKKYADLEGAQVLFGGWTGIDLSQWDDDQELQHVENNGMKTYIENLTKYNPGKKYTKKTISEKISLGGSTTCILVGSPTTVADEIERWVDASDIDGFNFTYATWPETFEDLVDLVIPELQKRGLAQKEYAVEGGTFRENLYRKQGQTFVPESHPAHKLRWTSDYSIEEFDEKIKLLKSAKK